MTSTRENQDGRDELLTPKPGQASTGPQSETAEEPIDPDEPTVQDWVEAEHSRPTLPDETADGLDDMDEEIRHQAEDQPLDTPGRLR